MTTPPLFTTRAGQTIGRADLTRSLRSVGADQARVLFVHTALEFGMPNPALSRRQILEETWGALCDCGVPTIVVPTFTFSFCNQAAFDVQRSRSRMGALNEYVRQLPGVRRSVDPLLSVAEWGQPSGLAEGLGHASIGPGSSFDRLHQAKGARFLFYGADLTTCFTYLHFVERCLNVPYRYDRAFSGEVIDNGRSTQETYQLFVRYQGVKPRATPEFYDRLEREGVLRRARAGDGPLASIDEPAAYEAFAAKLREDPHYFLEAPVPSNRDDHFEAHEMVAL